MFLASSSYSYPVLGVFWTILMIFLWVIWFWILITIIIDIFRANRGPPRCGRASTTAHLTPPRGDAAG
jgi:hypothetical protein